VAIQTQPTRRTKAGLVPSLLNPAWTAGREAPVSGWYAEVQASGLTLQVSRIDGEGHWTIDAAFRGSYPLWSNSFGARYLLTKVLAADLAAELDAAMAPKPALEHHLFGGGVIDGTCFRCGRIDSDHMTRGELGFLPAAR